MFTQHLIYAYRNIYADVHMDIIGLQVTTYTYAHRYLVLEHSEREYTVALHLERDQDFQQPHAVRAHILQLLLLQHPRDVLLVYAGQAFRECAHQLKQGLWREAASLLEDDVCREPACARV